VKRWIAVLIPLCFATAGCGAVRVVTPDDEHPLVLAASNGGFEEKGPHGGAADWWRLGGPNESYAMELDPDVVHSGSASGRVDYKRGEPGWGAWNQSYDPTAFAGKKIHLSAWIKTERAETCGPCTKPGQTTATLDESIRKGAEVRINQSAANYKAITPFVTGTSDWTRFEAEAVIEPHATSIIIAPILWGKGRAWFDDIKVTVTEVAK
jgi:hypothetical protein